MIYCWKPESMTKDPYWRKHVPAEFAKGKSVSWTSSKYGKVSGKINQEVEDDYYGGDCLVLYITPSKSTLKKMGYEVSTSPSKSKSSTSIPPSSYKYAGKRGGKH